jgi:hypothetical protein
MALMPAIGRSSVLLGLFLHVRKGKHFFLSGKTSKLIPKVVYRLCQTLSFISSHQHLGQDQPLDEEDYCLLVYFEPVIIDMCHNCWIGQQQIIDKQIGMN